MSLSEGKTQKQELNGATSVLSCTNMRKPLHLEGLRFYGKDDGDVFPKTNPLLTEDSLTGCYIKPNCACKSTAGNIDVLSRFLCSIYAVQKQEVKPKKNMP